MGDVESVELAEEPKWEWTTPNHVSFDTVAVFNRKSGCCKLEHYEQVFGVTLERDDMNAPWRFSASQPAEQGKTLAVENRSADELAEMLTMTQVADEKPAQATLDAALKGPSKYRDQYCEIPMMKPDERSTINNKAKSFWTRLGIVEQGNELKLSSVQVGMVKGDRLAELQALKDPCPKPLTAAQRALSVPKADGSGVWKIGDRVQCRYKGRNRTYPGKIADIKGNQLFVEYDDGDEEWTTAEMLK